MENQKIKLDYKIIKTTKGNEFIFPAYPIRTQEELEEKIV